MRALLSAPSLLLIAVLAAWPATARSAEHVDIKVGPGEMPAVMFVPNKTPAPGVIVLHTSYGQVEGADETYAAALAKEGFVALAPNYLTFAHGKLWSKYVDLQLRGVLNWFAHRPETAGRKIGAVGFSLGADAISLSALDRRIRAAVVYYGAYDARAAKQVRLSSNIKLPIQYAPDVHAPVLMLHGAEDDEIPLSIARAMEAALKAASKNVELVVYPGATHRFDRGGTHGDMRANSGAWMLYTYRYDAAATADAWKRTLAFLKANLEN